MFSDTNPLRYLVIVKLDELDELDEVLGVLGKGKRTFVELTITNVSS